MNHHVTISPLHRAYVFLLVLLFLIPSLPVFAANIDLPPITITLQWNEGETAMSREASAVTYEGYETSYWLFVPGDVASKNPQLIIIDNTAQYSGFSMPSGNVLPPFEDANDTLGVSFIQIDALDPKGQIVVTYFLYISTTAEQPAIPEPLTVNPVNVTVYYRTTDGTDIATSQTILCYEGQTAVNALPFDLQDNYVLTGDGTQYVTVDANGADKTKVVFIYTHSAPIVNPVDIAIFYRTSEGVDVASSQLITCYEGQNAINALPFDLQDYFVLTGDETQYVTVDENGADRNEVVFIYSYSAPAVNPVDVIVRYRTSEGVDVASSQIISCNEGITKIHAQPYDLLSGYILTGESVQYVTVDENGADSDEIEFIYSAPVIEPIDVYVYYRDAKNNDIAQLQVVTCYEGTNSIQAAPESLPAGYVLTSESTQYVIVTASGANVQEIVFRYKYADTETQIPTATPQPAPKISLVSVFYRDQNNIVLWNENIACIEGVENKIVADLSRVPEGYALNDENFKYVNVDSNGIANPSEVVFLFSAPSNTSITAEITVRYLNEKNEDIALPQTVTCFIGNNIIYAEPHDLQPGYLLLSDAMQSVTLSENGFLSAEEIVFIYQKISTEPTSPVVTFTPGITSPPEVLYHITPMNAYCYPKSDSVNFRSSPTTEDGNVLSVVNISTLGHITGSLVNSKDETWYAVTIDGIGGYMKEAVIRILSEAETAALFNFTAVPSIAPTAVPTDIPDGAVIDLWGEVNSNSVNFRTSPSIENNNKIASLARGKKVWIYTVSTVNNEKWYSIRTDGKDGYLMANYITSYSQEQSSQYQMQLATPMPTQITGATPVIAETNTLHPIVTTTPSSVTSIPDITSTPQPYTGYALTTQQAALRTGISMTDETILATLPANTLVYLWGQAYVDNTGWNSAEAIGISVSGYLPDSVLRRITAAEAQYYLEILEPTASPTPVATALPAPYAGYAITLGDNVPMRSYANTNAMIVSILPENTIVQVIGQEYADGAAWHVVQYYAQWGYIREDQLRILNDLEVAGYLQSLKTPTPSPAIAATPAPITSGSLSSYGYVNTDKVRLRNGPGLDTTQLKMLNKHAFALVLGTATDNGGNTWYMVNQSGTEGYIMSTYFTVLTIGQLTEYLQSPEYLNAENSGNTTGNSTSDNITSVEDFNSGVWTNPSLVNATYEPFNPFGTATPSVEAILTPSPVPTAFIAPIQTVDIISVTPPPASPSSSFPVGLVIAAVLIIGGAGAVYAYMLHRTNQRRAAERAAQRRQSQTAIHNAQNYAQPMRTPGAPQPTQTYATPFMPPKGGAPIPPQAQRTAGTPISTRVYPPANPYAPPSAQGVNPYTAGQLQQPVRQNTVKPYTPGQVQQTTQNYSPSQTTQDSARSQSTQVYKPTQTNAQPAYPAFSTQVYSPVPETPELPQTPANEYPTPDQTHQAGQQVRRRRSDRHSN